MFAQFLAAEFNSLDQAGCQYILFMFKKLTYEFIIFIVSVNQEFNQPPNQLTNKQNKQPTSQPGQNHEFINLNDNSATLNQVSFFYQMNLLSVMLHNIIILLP